MPKNGQVLIVANKEYSLQKLLESTSMEAVN